MDSHIRQLLTEENRLTVPQLGTFAAHHITAQIIKDEGIILPPRKQVTLDSTEQEDDNHTFQNRVMKAEQIGEEEFRARLQDYVNKINEKISLYGMYEIPGVGILKRNEAGKLIIENSTDYNLLDDAYGLPKLAARPVRPAEPPKGKAVKDEPQRQTVVSEQPAAPPPKKAPVAEKVSDSSSSDRVWWLAMIPLIMLFVFLIYLMVDETAQLQFREWVAGESQEEVITELPQEEVTNDVPVDENTDMVSGDIAKPAPEASPESAPPAAVESQSKGSYMVVLGSLAKESAAKKMQKELASKGIQTEIIYNSERNTYRIAVTGLSEAAAKSKREELLELVPGAWIARPNQ